MHGGGGDGGYGEELLSKKPQVNMSMGGGSLKITQYTESNTRGSAQNTVPMYITPLFRMKWKR